MAQSAAAVTLAHHLATSYRPDVEFLNGELREKPLVSPVHGRVQMLLGVWFGRHEDEWGVQTLAEARTQVSDHAVRLPDVSVLAAGPLPRRALVKPPLLAIEVLRLQCCRRVTATAI
jgi:Uma2 family endonuclease